MRTRARGELEAAWAWRRQRKLLTPEGALRVFHGPGEGTGPLRHVAIDAFGPHFWVTQWEGGARIPPELWAELSEFLRARARGGAAVCLRRPEGKVAPEPELLFGSPPAERFEVDEQGLRFGIQLLGARHPGLFLDHEPLRSWLRQESDGRRVLNTFAYTGSLSIAAGTGGAAQVTTIDLAKPAIRWAEENWRRNSLLEARGRFIAGDIFAWLPRLRREGAVFELIILDPPSFSRGEKGTFSTARDLGKLHRLALALLAPGGLLVTSINSANVPRPKYAAEVRAAARAESRRLGIVREIGLPETFPTRAPADRYLKGWILKDIQGSDTAPARTGKPLPEL